MLRSVVSIPHIPKVFLLLLTPDFSSWSHFPSSCWAVSAFLSHPVSWSEYQKYQSCLIFSFTSKSLNVVSQPLPVSSLLGDCDVLLFLWALSQNSVLFAEYLNKKYGLRKRQQNCSRCSQSCCSYNFQRPQHLFTSVSKGRQLCKEFSVQGSTRLSSCWDVNLFS